MYRAALFAGGGRETIAEWGANGMAKIRRIMGRSRSGKEEHRHQLHGLLSPRTATLELTTDIVCNECFRFRYVTSVKYCIVPKALIVPRSKSMRSRPDNGKNVRQKRHSVP